MSLCKRILYLMNFLENDDHLFYRLGNLPLPTDRRGAGET